MTKLPISQIDIAIISASVIAVAVLMIVFPIGNFFVTVPVTKANVPVITPNIQNGGTPTASIVNTTKIIIPSANVTAVSQILDQSGCNTNQGICSASSPKLTINVQANLLDSNQRPILSSVYIPIPPQNSWVPQSWFSGLSLTKLAVTPSGKSFAFKPLSLTDAQGNDVTLGSVQVGFFGVVPQDATILATGDYVAKLDDKVEQAGHFGGQGTTKNQQLLFSISGLPVLTFTFSDELKTAADGSQHIFSIQIGNITATVQNGKSSAQYQLVKNSVAYILVMTANQQKQTVIGADNKAIAVFKSDDAINLCGRTGLVGNNVDYVGGTENNHLYISSPASNTGLVSVYENGFLLATGQTNAGNPSFNPQNPESIAPNSQGQKVCTMINGIPRDSDVTIVTTQKTYNFHTPVVQTTYSYDCSGSVASLDPLHASSQQVISGGCTTDFGLRN